ncbi:MAG: 1-deoxy-D-xylulose-5-phosphate synthase [Oscillospiraceae bacterium]|nr:1-deoxy-D-xylulose-5-phosphate synthase [Oscillospiraceae bacterium]
MSLQNINPARLKTFSLAEKTALCEEIRGLLISVVSKNGGHLASNLGAVELTIAMHSVFTTPRDKFIFDVGHQSYTHKILTGRLENFAKLRQEGGISGFPRPSESEHDAFIGGHSSISVSAGLGIAAAMSLKNETGSVIAVAGDGSFTGGEIYEGLNNAGKFKNLKNNFIVILNDNEMCISKNSGAFAAYLSQIRSSKNYHETKLAVKDFLAKSTIGKGVSGAIGETKKIVKGALIRENLFENLGFKYLGPADGHNLKELIEVLELAQSLNCPCLVHVRTKKGKGYMPAEENAGHYHGIDKHKKTLAKPALHPDISSLTYSEIFGREIAKLGEKDSRICLITAAMKHATGCNYFAKKHPERFFDVGIAEAHAASFAAGLSSAGLLPVFAVYSTFLQRCFDQLIHDAAIEKLRMVLAIDRAGLGGEDGPTHQGTFDVGLLSLIPGTKIYAPLTAGELCNCLQKSLYEDSGISAVRYPRGICVDPLHDDLDTIAVTDFYHYKNSEKTDKLIITYGRLSQSVSRLKKYGADILRLVQIHPLPQEIFAIIANYKDVIFFEEHSISGGVAEKLAGEIRSEIRYKMRGVSGFVPIANVERQLKMCGLSLGNMKNFAGL